MNALQLQYFLTVARLEHVSKAAQELNIAQPSLSKTIHHMEEELGVPLLVKQGRNVVLTEYGRIWYEYAEKALNELEKGTKEIHQLVKKETHKITISFRSAAMLATDIVSEIAMLYPDCDISVSDNNQADLTVNCSWEKERATNQCNLLHERIRIGLPINHPLSQKETLSIAEIKSLSFIMTTEANPIYDTIHYYLNRLNLQVHAALHITDPNLLCSMVSKEGYAAFIPELTWQKFHKENVGLHDIEGCVMDKYVYLQWKESEKDNWLLEACKKIILNYCKELQSRVNHL